MRARCPIRGRLGNRQTDIRVLRGFSKGTAQRHEFEKRKFRRASRLSISGDSVAFEACAHRTDSSGIQQTRELQREDFIRCATY